MLVQPRQQIERLLGKYHNLTQRELRDYNEANTRNVFVQPLFEALGWDFSDINQVEAETGDVLRRLILWRGLSGCLVIINKSKI